jgi:hypothetical protein
MDSTRKATILFLIGTAVGAVDAFINATLWMHSKRPEASIYTKLYFLFFGISVALGLWRVIWYRKRCDYFSEEMDHRRSLVKSSWSKG